MITGAVTRSVLSKPFVHVQLQSAASALFVCVFTVTAAIAIATDRVQAIVLYVHNLVHT